MPFPRVYAQSWGGTGKTFFGEFQATRASKWLKNQNLDDIRKSFSKIFGEHANMPSFSGYRVPELNAIQDSTRFSYRPSKSFKIAEDFTASGKSLQNAVKGGFSALDNLQKTVTSAFKLQGYASIYNGMNNALPDILSNSRGALKGIDEIFAGQNQIASAEELAELAAGQITRQFEATARKVQALSDIASETLKNSLALIDAREAYKLKDIDLKLSLQENKLNQTLSALSHARRSAWADKQNIKNFIKFSQDRLKLDLYAADLLKWQAGEFNRIQRNETQAFNQIQREETARLNTLAAGSLEFDRNRMKGVYSTALQAALNNTNTANYVSAARTNVQITKLRGAASARVMNAAISPMQRALMISLRGDTAINAAIVSGFNNVANAKINELKVLARIEEQKRALDFRISSKGQEAAARSIRTEADIERRNIRTQADIDRRNTKTEAAFNEATKKAALNAAERDSKLQAELIKINSLLSHINRTASLVYDQGDIYREMAGNEKAFIAITSAINRAQAENTYNQTLANLTFEFENTFNSILDMTDKYGIENIKSEIAINTATSLFNFQQDRLLNPPQNTGFSFEKPSLFQSEDKRVSGLLRGLG